MKEVQVDKFFSFLKNELNYSELTIKSYQLDLTDFFRFLEKSKKNYLNINNEDVFLDHFYSTPHKSVATYWRLPNSFQKIYFQSRPEYQNLRQCDFLELSHNEFVMYPEQIILF